MTTRQAGDRLPERAAEDLISTMHIDLLPIDLIVQWKRCSILADFLGQYFAYLFADRQGATRVLSTGLNEIVENLAKFSADKRSPVSLTVAHYGDQVRVSTRNVGSLANAEALASRLDRMANEDAELLFLEQLEHTASQDRASSGLGLITIKKDYGALLGVTLSPVEGHEGQCLVEFHLEIETSAVEQA